MAIIENYKTILYVKKIVLLKVVIKDWNKNRVGRQYTKSMFLYNTPNLPNKNSN